MKKTKLLAFLLSAVMLFPVSVSAADAAEEVITLNLDGLQRVAVTSSIAEIGGTDAASENFFDSIASTGCSVALEEGETPNEKILSIYTATRVPEAIETFAMLFGGESGTVLAVNVFATNDSLLLDWKQLTVEVSAEKEGDFHIINILNAPQKYSFYRIDITLASGTAFTLNEMMLYKDASDDTVYYWAATDELEAGELPELIAVPKKQEFPKLGLFSPFYPSIFRK